MSGMSSATPLDVMFEASHLPADDLFHLTELIDHLTTDQADPDSPRLAATVADARRMASTHPDSQFIAQLLATADSAICSRVQRDERAVIVDELRSLARSFPDDRGVAECLGVGLLALSRASSPTDQTGHVAELTAIAARFPDSEALASLVSEGLDNAGATQFELLERTTDALRTLLDETPGDVDVALDYSESLVGLVALAPT
jgi:hypothetical protein